VGYDSDHAQILSVSQASRSLLKHRSHLYYLFSLPYQLFSCFSKVFCFSAEAYIPSVPGAHGFKRDDFRAADLYIAASPDGHIRYIA
jgi:hypothetical protein